MCICYLELSNWPLMVNGYIYSLTFHQVGSMNYTSGRLVLVQLCLSKPKQSCLTWTGIGSTLMSTRTCFFCIRHRETGDCYRNCNNHILCNPHIWTSLICHNITIPFLSPLFFLPYVSLIIKTPLCRHTSEEKPKRVPAKKMMSQ